MKKFMAAAAVVGGLFISAPLAHAEQGQTATITVVISEEAARYHRENPVPDHRPRDTAMVNEQSEVFVAGISGPSSDTPKLVSLAAAMFYLLARTTRRLRTATAVG